ncbi:MAG: sulfatase-like hydrolase/transferase [Myxococcota bacterium]
MWSILLAACGSSPPPNVLVFTLDTTRYDAIGANNPNLPSATPNIDRLAAEGVRFTRAYTVTPLTIPAHSSLHTGLLPPRHGVRDNGDAFLSPEAVTLAERLRGAGYATMAAVGAEVTSHHWGFDQGFDAYFDALEAKENRWRVERRADEVAADARGWFATAPTDRPWFAWVHFFDAHFPYAAPDGATSGLDPYRAEVAFVDHTMGELLKSLPQEVLDHTWIFVLADHGEGLGEHGEAMHGVLLYDGTTHVPLIVRPPGGAPARVVDAPASVVDLYPTILSLAGVADKGDVDGFDLAPVLRDGAEPLAQRGVYVESLYAYEHYGWAKQRAWADTDRKYIDSTTPELYARADVREADDLLFLQPDQAKRMKDELEAYVATLEPEASLSSAASTNQAQLEALGYVTSDVEVDPNSGPLPDPVQKLPVLVGVEQSRQLMRTGDLEGAKLKITEVIAQDPALVDPRLLLAMLQEGSGDMQGAIATLDQLLTIRRSSRVLLQLGNLKMHTGEWQLGRALIEEAKELDPYLPQTWYTYLPILWAQGDTAAFQQAVQEAVGRVEADPVVRGYEGLSLLVDGKHAEAIPLLRAGLEPGPRVFLYSGLGAAYRALGDDAAAEQAFESEVDTWPPAIPARRQLVAIFAEQRRYDEQLQQLDAISAAEEPSIDTFHSRAQVLFNLERFEEAKGVVDECRRFAPKYPGCALLAANVLDKLRRPDEARAAYEQALALAGQQPPPADPRKTEPMR